MLGLALLATALPTRPAAAGPLRATATQTLRTTRLDEDGIRGDYLVSFSSCDVRNDDWNLRVGVSWLRWRDDGGAFAVADDSGPGAAYVTAGRRLWRMGPGGRAGSGWLRLRGKLPLQDAYDVTGTGETDWGVSLFASRRLGRFSLLGELGATALGDPAGLDYRDPASLSLSLGYAVPGSRIYPFAGFAAATSALAGDPGYGEWNLGAGFLASRRVSASAAYSRGLSDASPAHSLAVSVTLRL